MRQLEDLEVTAVSGACYWPDGYPWEVWPFTPLFPDYPLY